MNVEGIKSIENFLYNNAEYGSFNIWKIVAIIGTILIVIAFIVWKKKFQKKNSETK
jgi:lipoprotein signal peptidase